MSRTFEIDFFDQKATFTGEAQGVNATSGSLDTAWFVFRGTFENNFPSNGTLTYKDDLKLNEHLKLIEYKGVIAQIADGYLVYGNGEMKAANVKTNVKVALQGKFVKGQLNGQGAIISETGVEQRGVFKNSALSGQGQIRFPAETISGTFISSREFSGPHGYVEKVSSNGEQFKGFVFKGKRYGPGVIIAQQQDSGLFEWRADSLVRKLGTARVCPNKYTIDLDEGKELQCDFKKKQMVVADKATKQPLVYYMENGDIVEILGVDDITKNLFVHYQYTSGAEELKECDNSFNILGQGCVVSEAGFKAYQRDAKTKSLTTQREIHWPHVQEIENVQSLITQNIELQNLDTDIAAAQQQLQQLKEQKVEATEIKQEEPEEVITEEQLQALRDELAAKDKQAAELAAQIQQIKGLLNFNGV